jgi:hypothetical protein
MRDGTCYDDIIVQYRVSRQPLVRYADTAFPVEAVVTDRPVGISDRYLAVLFSVDTSGSTRTCSRLNIDEEPAFHTRL